MKTFRISIIFLAISGIGLSGGYYQVHHDQNIEGISFPDHLLPVRPRLHSWQREYRRRVEDHLFVTNPDVSQYLVMPAFAPESCVSVRSEIPKEAEEAYEHLTLVPEHKRKFFITLTRAAENLWYSMASNNDEGRNRQVDVVRLDREISPELAVSIQSVWGRMLHHTRLPSAALFDGHDGCTYEFSARVVGLGDVAGEIWSPEGGLTAEMVSLGDRISAFASNDGTPEDELIKALNEFETKIPEVDKSPIYVAPPSNVPADPFSDPEPQGTTEKKEAE